MTLFTDAIKQVVGSADFKQIPLRDSSIKAGYYLFEGDSSFRGVGLIVYLVARTATDVSTFPVLIAANGRFREVVKLPTGVQACSLVYCRQRLADDKLHLSEWHLQTLNPWQRYVVYLKLTLPALLTLTRLQRHQIGLYWYTAYFSPEQAYNAVSANRHRFSNITYTQWLEQVDKPSRLEAQLIQSFRDSWLQASHQIPLILIDARKCSSSLSLEATLDSIQQGYLQPKHLWLLVDDDQLGAYNFKLKLKLRLSFEIMALSDLSNRLRGVTDTSHLLWLTAGCQIHPQALLWFAAEAYQHPDASLIYSDHDHLDESGGRCLPFFKPDIAIEMLLSSGYPGRVFSVKLALVCAYLQQDSLLSPYGLLIHTGGQLNRLVRHIPAILWHQPGWLSETAFLDPGVLRLFLQQHERNAWVSVMPSGNLRIHDDVPDPQPLVSIIIPTRDRLDMLIPCVTSVLKSTDYASLEVLIIDNQSELEETHQYFENVVQDPRVRVIAFNHRFNYSAINNFAADQARGTYLCLLNNDTCILNSDWLSEMVSVAELPGVGVVGAQLRYPDGRLQHAGDLVGGSGCANHLYGPLAEKDSGYMGRVELRQELSAVTAACLLTPRSLFLQLGGLNQNRLVVAFNDVDYCLRVGEAGYRVIYTPFARLTHHESESRGADVTREQRRRSFKEAQYMRKRWAKVMYNDPFYNPNLNYYRCDFSLDPLPVIHKPWDN